MVTGGVRAMKCSTESNRCAMESPFTNRCDSVGAEPPVANRCHSAPALALAVGIDGVAMRIRQPQACGYRLRNIMTDEDIERWHIRMTPDTYF